MTDNVFERVVAEAINDWFIRCCDDCRAATLEDRLPVARAVLHALATSAEAHSAVTKAVSRRFALHPEEAENIAACILVALDPARKDDN